jgi:glycosyltransferase involved in cell wall biosynthesis
LENYRLLRGLSDQELSDAYAGASAFLWPSRLEGFGLPPLEAMGNGCPVVSSDGPAMPEVLGNAPLYFSPDDPGALASRLRELWADPDEWRRRADAGRARAAEFSCRRMAEETVAVWKAAASGGDRS